MQRITCPRLLLLATALTGCFTLTAPVRGQFLYEDFKVMGEDTANKDLFGGALAIDNGILAVGAADGPDRGVGSAYTFDASTGEQLAKIVSDDGEIGDSFGECIAIADGIVAVGARYNTHQAIKSGAAYLFDARTGVQLHKLLPDDRAERDFYGYSIAIANGIVAIGAILDDDMGTNSGSVWLFDVATGQQLFKLLPDDRADNDSFGSSIAIHNGIVAVGAAGDDGNGRQAGAVYLFDAATGMRLAKLLPDDGEGEVRFGNSIAMTDGIVAIGAWKDNENGYQSGAAYLFDVATGQQLLKLRPDKPAESDWFGSSIVVNKEIVVVGAEGNEFRRIESGVAYVFDTATGSQLAMLYPSDAEGGEFFGQSVAMDQDVIAAGAPDDDERGFRAGAAYLYDVNSLSHCIHLTIKDLNAGAESTFTITGGTPNAKAVIVYGTKLGHTFLYRYARYCATFGIKGVHQGRVLGGFNQYFDFDGEITFKRFIPERAADLSLFFQSAERGTCPDACMSNLIEMVVGQ